SAISLMVKTSSITGAALQGHGCTPKHCAPAEGTILQVRQGQQALVKLSGPTQRPPLNTAPVLSPRYPLWRARSSPRRTAGDLARALCARLGESARRGARCAKA